MRFRVTPFTHPEYSALLERSQPLALLWGMGHVFMIVFLAMALVAPLGVVMLALIDPELTRGRAWDLAGSCTGAPLLVSAIGFSARLYAKKRGKSLPR